MKDSAKDYLVSDRYCTGCIYYGYLSPSARMGGRCCDYTYCTGRIRQGTTRNCHVKTLPENTIPQPALPKKAIIAIV